jgi:hypothetical protein
MTKDNFFLVLRFPPRIVFLFVERRFFSLDTSFLFDARLFYLRVFCSFYNSFIIFTIFIVIEMLILTAVMSRLYINPAYIILRL